jgi:hypothetical protein
MATSLARAMTLAVASLVVLAGCSNEPESEPRIRDYEPGSGGALGQEFTKAGTPYAFDDATLCLTERGAVTIEKVEVAEPTGGLRVQMFSIRPARQGQQFNYLSDPRQRLAEVGYPTKGPMIVDRKCPKDTTKTPGGDEGASLLAVELVKPANATATGNGFVVTYRSNRKQHQVYVPLGIVLCSGKTEKLPECKHKLDLRPPEDK